MKKYNIKLSNKERQQLQTIIKKGMSGARVIARARILLACESGASDAAIAGREHTTDRTVRRIRRRYRENGFDQAVYDAPRPGTPPALNETQETRLVAIACSDPPAGREHWTIELLQKKLIKDKIVDRVSVGTICTRLKERGIKPWREKNVVHS